MLRPPPTPTLFPYTTLFRSGYGGPPHWLPWPSDVMELMPQLWPQTVTRDDAGRLVVGRSEEHTSELQSRRDLVCRLLLEKKKTLFRSCTGRLLTSTIALCPA